MTQQIQWSRVEPSEHPLEVSCDTTGPSIGPIRLLKQTSRGFEPRDMKELDFILGRALGYRTDIARRERALQSAASAISKGDLAHAILITQFMELPSLPANAAFDRAVEAEALAKGGFDPDQERDAHGRWTAD